MNNALQIRCTIQAARAAHAQFELAHEHEHEHECVDTGGKQVGDLRGTVLPPKEADKGVQQAGVAKPDLRGKLTPKAAGKGSDKGSGKGGYAVARGPAAQGFSGPGASSTQPTPQQKGQVDGFSTALQKIVPTILRNNDKMLPFVLVDGRNLFSKKGATQPQDRWSELIGETARCLPSTGGQVIVVWTKLAWKYHGCDINAENRKMYANWLKPLAASGTKVLFLVLQFDKKQTDPQYIEKCIGNVVKDPGAGGKSCDVQYTRKEAQCLLPGMAEAERSHLACELDDVLLSALHCRLINANRAVQVVSLDKSILKNPLDVNAVMALLDRPKAAAEFKQAVWTYEVPLAWP